MKTIVFKGFLDHLSGRMNSYRKLGVNFDPNHYLSRKELKGLCRFAASGPVTRVSKTPCHPSLWPVMDPQAAGVLIMAIILSAYVVYLLYIRDGF
jgi:hypothetical protein